MGAAFHNLQGDNRLFFSFLFFFFLFWPSKFLFSSSIIFLWEILFFFFNFLKGTFFIVLVDILVLQFCVDFFLVFFLSFLWYWYCSPEFYYLSCFWSFYLSIGFCEASDSISQVFNLIVFWSIFCFYFSIDFCCLLNNIRILGIMFMFLSFSFFFLQL